MVMQFLLSFLFLFCFKFGTPSVILTLSKFSFKELPMGNIKWQSTQGINLLWKIRKQDLKCSFMSPRIVTEQLIFKAQRRTGGWINHGPSLLLCNSVRERRKNHRDSSRNLEPQSVISNGSYQLILLNCLKLKQYSYQFPSLYTGNHGHMKFYWAHWQSLNFSTNITLRTQYSI